MSLKLVEIYRDYQQNEYSGICAIFIRVWQPGAGRFTEALTKAIIDVMMISGFSPGAIKRSSTIQYWKINWNGSLTGSVTGKVTFHYPCFDFKDKIDLFITGSRLGPNGRLALACLIPVLLLLRFTIRELNCGIFPFLKQ